MRIVLLIRKKRTTPIIGGIDRYYVMIRASVANYDSEINYQNPVFDHCVTMVNNDKFKNHLFVLSETCIA